MGQSLLTPEYTPGVIVEYETLTNSSPTSLFTATISPNKPGYIPVSVGFATYRTTTTCIQCRLTPSGTVSLGFVENLGSGTVASGKVATISIVYIKV